MGLYRLGGISFPVSYRAVDPATSFVPLGYQSEMTLTAVLEETETGAKYAPLLREFGQYPFLVDSGGEVLSFPPVLNSQGTGCLTAGDSEIFCEVTGSSPAAGSS